MFYIDLILNMTMLCLCWVCLQPGNVPWRRGLPEGAVSGAESAAVRFGVREPSSVECDSLPVPLQGCSRLKTCTRWLNWTVL